MYFTDRGIEELQDRRGDETVALSWVADRMHAFLEIHPGFETPVNRLATWLARFEQDDAP
jgi:hypothetical protein